MFKFKNKINNAIMIAGATAATAAGSILPAFAAPAAGSGAGFDNFFNTIGGLTENAGKNLTALLTPVAIVAIGYCGIRMLMTKDQKKMEAYKDWLIRIFIIAVVVFAAPSLFEFAKNLGSQISF